MEKLLISAFLITGLYASNSTDSVDAAATAGSPHSTPLSGSGGFDLSGTPLPKPGPIDETLEQGTVTYSDGQKRSYIGRMPEGEKQLHKNHQQLLDMRKLLVHSMQEKLSQLQLDDSHANVQN